MRSLTLAKGGLNKIRAHQKELKQVDVEDSIKSLPPGEWCFFIHPGLTQRIVGFVNPLIEEKYNCIQLVETIDASIGFEFSPSVFIKRTLLKAFNKRKQFKNYQDGSRIFYGAADGLPGLIIDQFKHQAIIQINSAGVDKYRDEIKAEIELLISGKAYFLDNPKYREKESLPTFSTETIPSIEIIENGIHYAIRAEVIQKVGFYYDHRENRFQLVQLLSRLNHKFKNGADLFCYAGAWGMSALMAGVSNVNFVDQGNFEAEISNGLKLNGLEGRGVFSRSDVFSFLDSAVAKHLQFDLILCDPPAFAKSLSQKHQALEGYSKLHRKVLKAAAPGAFLAFSSCTQYVSHEEFQKNILEAAIRENKNLQLIYTGIQGWDHPIRSQMDKTNYIKSYFYIMES